MKVNYNLLDAVEVRLVKDHTLYSNKVILNSRDAIELITEELKGYDREAFCILNLASNGRPINFNIVSVGAVNQTIVSMREVFKASILSNAAAIIAIHNHPSGNTFPSEEDMEVIARLIKCGEIIGIPIIDSLICGAGGTNNYSFMEEGDMERLREQNSKQHN